MMRHPAGKGIPESAEVAQARMDAEACELASSNAPKRPRVPNWVAGTLMGFFLYGLVTGIFFAAALAGGAQL